MPTYYVEDYDGPRDEEATEPAPEVTAKVVESDTPAPAKKTSRAKTKG